MPCYGEKCRCPLRPQTAGNRLAKIAGWLAICSPFRRVCRCFRWNANSIWANWRRCAKKRAHGISWVALFVKAYGLLAADIVELRQSYMNWPWPHIFQHEHSVAMVAVNRSTPIGDRLFWGRFTAPEKMPLTEIQTQLDDYKHGQIEKTFRRQMRSAAFRRHCAGWRGG